LKRFEEMKETITKDKNKNKLNQAQKDLIFQWIIEGLSDQQIVKRAKEQNQFELSIQGINYYRNKKDVAEKKEKITEKRIEKAMLSGLVKREKRINEIEKIFEDMKKIVEKDGYWIDESKTILTQNYETTETKRTFNYQLPKIMLQCLDDIAKEMGERKGTPAINNFLIGDDALAALKKTYQTLPDPNVIDGEYTTNETE